jgi:hypothetical protein
MNGRGGSNGEADYTIIMKKCRCGRVFQSGKWVRPTGADLQDISDNYHRILFKDCECDKCGKTVRNQ